MAVAPDLDRAKGKEPNKADTMRGAESKKSEKPNGEKRGDRPNSPRAK